MYEAVNMMTTMPADRLGLKNKGRLNVGADADVVVFDPEKISDCASFSEPVLPAGRNRLCTDRRRIAAKDCRIVDPRLGRSVRKV